jgi:hypothetical protein
MLSRLSKKGVMFRNELVRYKGPVVNGRRIDGNPINHAGLDFSGFGNVLMKLGELNHE